MQTKSHSKHGITKKFVHTIFDMMRRYAYDEPMSIKALERKILKEINDEEKTDKRERAKQYTLFGE